MLKQIVLLSAALGLVAAQPRHGHMHLHEKKAPSPVADASAGPTVVVYSLNGIIISYDEVMEGIQNGTLVWANGAPEFASDVSSSSSTYSTSFASSSSYSAPTSTSISSSSSSSSYVAPTSSSVYSSSSAWSSSAYSSAASSSTSSSYSSSSSSSGVTTTFPDGEISCDTFPSDYGAVAVDHLGNDGWTGIQYPQSLLSAGFSDINTITSGGCADGYYCSYACPAGYQKAQWPSTQGATGQSVGGLLCKDGYLYKTNSDFDTLCITGTTEVTILVENNMDELASICRTDYPGTESETIPLSATASNTVNLTCPDASNYYTWEGSSTSAQYYVNPKGVDISDACTWGSSANPWGNFAPVNLGVGYSDGAAWLSIFQNYPTTEAELDFTIEIKSDSDMSGTCRYSNGKYCSGDDYETCNTYAGCTVSISSGTATFVFSSS